MHKRHLYLWFYSTFNGARILWTTPSKHVASGRSLDYVHQTWQNVAGHPGLQQASAKTLNIGLSVFFVQSTSCEKEQSNRSEVQCIETSVCCSVLLLSAVVFASLLFKQINGVQFSSRQSSPWETCICCLVTAFDCLLSQRGFISPLRWQVTHKAHPQPALIYLREFLRCMYSGLGAVKH